jgi:hypothetical protein
MLSAMEIVKRTHNSGIPEFSSAKIADKDLTTTRKAPAR